MTMLAILNLFLIIVRAMFSLVIIPFKPAKKMDRTTLMLQVQTASLIWLLLSKCMKLLLIALSLQLLNGYRGFGESRKFSKVKNDVQCIIFGLSMLNDSCHFSAEFTRLPKGSTYPDTLMTLVPGTGEI